MYDSLVWNVFQMRLGLVLVLVKCAGRLFSSQLVSMHLLSFCEVLAKKNSFANLPNSYPVRGARNGNALAPSVQELLPTD